MTGVRLPEPAGQAAAGRAGQDMTFADAGHDLDDDIDAARRSKDPPPRRPHRNCILSPQARATIEPVPR
jgi:hypothetical protein